MSINHNRIKVADLEKGQPNKILATNDNGELEFKDKVAGKGLSTEDYTTAEKTSVATIGNKVDKVTGKGLSTEDYTTAEKTSVATIGNKVDKVTGKGLSTEDYTTAEKNKLLQQSGVNTGDQDLSVFYTKQEVDNKLSSVYKFKGNINNYAGLPSANLTVGDVYNLLDTGANYAWTGTVWDKLGDTIDISGKVDKTASHYIGTTQISNTRTSAAQTLTGVSIDGNAATAANVAWSGITSKPTTLSGYGISSGSGSGLDADLLDGQHGSYYASASSLSNYLPLSGGSLTGTLSMGNGGVLNLNRAGNFRHALTYYSSSQRYWSTYMGQAGIGGTGPLGDITPPNGTLVTGWGMRFYAGDGVGEGWVFESGANTSTPIIKAEISSNTGAARFTGNINAVGLINTAWGTTSGTSTGTINTLMGTASGASWLLSGTSNGTFRYGIQGLDSGNNLRFYVGSSWMNFDGTNITNATGNAFIHSGNYNSYAPTLSGVGASGTWGINIGGNASTSSTLNYGGAQNVNTSGVLPSGIQAYGVYNNGYPTSYGNVLNIGGLGYGQLLIGWSGTTGAHADNYIRSLRDSGIGANNWSPWAKIITDANISNYVGGGLYVDLTTNQSSIGGYKTFTKGMTINSSVSTDTSLNLTGTFANGIYGYSDGLTRTAMYTASFSTSGGTSAGDGFLAYTTSSSNVTPFRVRLDGSSDSFYVTGIGNVYGRMFNTNGSGGYIHNGASKTTSGGGVLLADGYKTTADSSKVVLADGSTQTITSLVSSTQQNSYGGSMKFPNGIIMKWGKFSSTVNGTPLTINLQSLDPISTFHSIQMNVHGVPTGNGYIVRSKTTGFNSFTYAWDTFAGAGNGQTCEIHWFVIGT